MQLTPSPSARTTASCADTVSDDAVRPGDHIASAGDYRASRIHNHFASGAHSIEIVTVL